MYTTMGAYNRGSLGQEPATVAGPLGPEDFSRFAPRYDFAALIETLLLASGSDPQGIGYHTPTLPDGTVIIPGPPVVGGWGTGSDAYRRWVALVWGVPTDDPGLSAAWLEFDCPGASSYNVNTCMPAWGGMNYWRRGLSIGTLAWEGFAFIQSMYGIPVEGWAGPNYCGDVIAAADLGQPIGSAGTPACQVVISLAQAESGQAGGVIVPQQGPPLILGTGGDVEVPDTWIPLPGEPAPPGANGAPPLSPAAAGFLNAAGLGPGALLAGGFGLFLLMGKRRKKR